MMKKIWLVSKFYRDYYEGDSMELSDRIAFLSEEEAKNYIGKMKDEIEKMISVWKECRTFDSIWKDCGECDYWPDDDMERTEPERKFSYMTNQDPWYFRSEDEVREFCTGYVLDEILLYVNEDSNE